MSLLGDLKVLIRLTAKDETAAETEKASSGFQKVWDKVTGLAKAVAALAAAKMLGNFLKESVLAANEAERSQTALRVAVENTGGSFEALGPDLETTVRGLQRVTRYADEDLRDALTNMVTLTGDVAGSQRNLALAADLAAARNIGLREASDMVAKAMNGNVMALNRLGIAGKDADTVLGNLAASMGGRAAEDAKTLSGRVDQLKNGWGDFKEAVGRAVTGLGGGEGFTGIAGTVVDWLAKLTDWVEANASSFADFLEPVQNTGRALWELVKGPLALLGELLGAVLPPLWQSFVWVVEKGQLALQGALAGLQGGLGALFVTVGELMTGAKGLLSKIGIDLGPGIAEKMAATGRDMVERAKQQMASLGRATEETEQKQTTAVRTGGQTRVRLTTEELKAREEAQKKAAAEATRREEQLAKELEKINTDLAVKTLMIFEGMTEKQAQEAIRRRRLLGEQIAHQVSDVREGWTQIDSLNLVLAAGFSTRVLPAVQQTTATIREIVAPGGPLTQYTVRVKDVDGAMRTNQETTKGWAAETEKAGLKADDAAQAAISFARGVQAIDAETAASLQNLLTFGNAMAKVAGGDPSAIISVVGGLTGLLGSIFRGNAALDQARQRWLQENTRALEDSTRAVGDLTRLQTPGRTFADVGSVLRGILADPAAFFREAHAGRVVPDIRAALARRLLEMGISMTEFERMVKDIGGGQLDFGRNLGWFFQQVAGLVDLIGAKEPTLFPQDFAGQLDRIRRAKDIGAVLPEEELREVVQALSGAGATGLLDALAGIDLSTEAGAAEAVANLRAVFARLSTGELRPEALGRLSGTQFADALTMLVKLLRDEVADVGGVLVPGRGSGKDRRLLEGDWDFAAVFGEGFDELTVVGLEQVDLLRSIDRHLSDLVVRGREPVAIHLDREAVVIHVEGDAGGPDEVRDAVASGVQRGISFAVEELERRLAVNVRDLQATRGEPPVLG